jgi:hypothetical protein
MKQRIATLLVTAGLAAAACGGTSESLETRDFADKRAQSLYTSFAEAMPTVSYVIDGSAPVTASDLYVRGAVTDVVAGSSFLWQVDVNGENEERVELKFNEEGAMISTVHLTIRPDVVITAGRNEQPTEVVVGLALEAPADPVAVAEEFKRYGNVALVLHKSPVFDYEPSAWTILEDGALLATVGDDGVLRFPALDADEQSRLAPEPLVIGDLEVAKDRVIELTVDSEGVLIPTAD